jgi:hypothetical protein
MTSNHRYRFLGVAGHSYLLPLLVAGLLLPLGACSGVQQQVNPETGLSSWKAAGDALGFELVQVVPDYVRAVYSARGLPQAIVDAVSSYCVFGTILHNTTQQPLAYRVADWRYITPDGVRHRIKTKSEWVGEWREMGVAFRWSLLPDDQTYNVGDWGQGFTTIGLQPGDRFDLEYSWRQGDVTFTRTIREVQCAPVQAPLQ